MKQTENLKFNKDGTFKILCFGDLHEKLVIEDIKSQRKFNDMSLFMKTAVKALNPDFAVLLGDTLCIRDETEGFTLYKAAIKNILQPILDANIPFGYVMGNHEHDTAQEELIKEAYDQFQTCYVYNDDPNITGDLNCYVPIRSSDDTKDAFIMWFIDSNGSHHDQSFSRYDWVKKDQIEWYEKKAAEIKQKNNGTVPAVLFQHIPISEEYELLREAKLWERPIAVKGHFKWGDKYYVSKGIMDGYLGEGPCAPYQNAGQFDSWKKTGDIKGAFFGHDHVNDFTGNLDGILLGQNKTSGFRAYTDGCRSAVRLITLYEKTGEISTKVYHFKEFGLKCTSLGPIMKRITDRQSINMHWASYILGASAAAIGSGVLLHKLIKKRRQ
ncbi:MAG TPA: metallophosphoesterase family protein [Clostridia bacterium]|nr:metallophosphoesterase family protein [Clostridia bacterium]